MKDVALHVRETTVKLPNVGDELSGSIYYSLQFLCCGLRRTSQPAAGIISCARGDTICLCPLKVDNIFAVIRHWHLFRHVGYLKHQQQVDLRP